MLFGAEIMSRWIVVCMLAALICGNRSESQYDDDDINDSPSLEIAPDTDSYNSDTQPHIPIPKPRVMKSHQTPIRNKIHTMTSHHININNQMADMYTENHKRYPAKSNHPISDLIFRKGSLLNPSDSIETYHPPNIKSEKVDERRKRLKSTPEREITRNINFKKGQEHSREFNSASYSDDENEAYRIPKLVTVKHVMHKKKREHENPEVIMHESELDASNDKYISKLKRENANMKLNRVAKNSNYNKHNHRHENNKAKTERQNTLQPERILSTSAKMHKHKIEPRMDFVATDIEPNSKKNKPNTHHSKHNQHEKYKEKHHVMKPGSVEHFSLKDIVRQYKAPDQHKVNKKDLPETQMNSLELEDAMAKPNGLFKPYDGDTDLKDEFTLTVVDINETPKNQKTVYKFRDEGNQLPVQKMIENQNNVIPPINMPAASDQGIEYSVPLIPVKNDKKEKRTTTLKTVEPIAPLPEVEIGVHDIKNENKLNSTVHKSKKEEINDFSKAELHLTQSSEESDDGFAYIGYVSDKHNRGKKMKDLLRDANVKSDEKKIARKSYLGCLGKKAQKICIKSCKSAYKNVCRRLKCSSKAKKDLKTQCKKSCRKVFGTSKDSDSSKSSSSDSGSSDSSF